MVNSPTFFFLLATSLLAIEGAATQYGDTPDSSPIPDVLEQPALISARVAKSVLLAITQAGQRLVAVGERGIVLFSGDGAISWQQAQTPVSVTLNAVHFVTEKKGWVVGHSGTVLHTEDGGTSWVKQLDGNGAARLMLEAAQKNAIARDDDKARQQLSEAQHLVREGADKPFFDIWFSDEKRGFIVGAYGLFFATQDGGRTWLPWQAHLDNPNGKHLYSIKGLGDLVYIVGEEGALYRSVDAGQTFVELKSPYQGSYFGVMPFEKEKVVIHGLRGNAYLSESAGDHWRKIDSGTANALTAGLVLSDGSIVLASQAGEVLRSTDHGRSFQTLKVAQPLPFSSVAQGANDKLILSSPRGIVQVLIP